MDSQDVNDMSYVPLVYKNIYIWCWVRVAVSIWNIFMLRNIVKIWLQWLRKRVKK